MKSWNVSFSAARGGRVWLGRLHYIHTSRNSNYESRSGRDSGTRVCANVRKRRLNEDTPCPYFPSRPQTRASLAGGLREGTRKPQPRSSREGDPLSCFACDRAVPQNVGLPAPRGKSQEKNTRRSRAHQQVASKCPRAAGGRARGRRLFLGRRGRLRAGARVRVGAQPAGKDPHKGNSVCNVAEVRRRLKTCRRCHLGRCEV